MREGLIVLCSENITAERWTLLAHCISLQLGMGVGKDFYKVQHA